MRRLGTLTMLCAAAAALVACGSDESSDSTNTRSTEQSSNDSTSEASSSESTSVGDEPSADGCPPEAGTSEQTRQFDAEPPDCLDPDATYEAVVTTNQGELTIALDPASAPVATNNFVFLARNRYYDDTACHRIIPNFVVQCGDPTATGTGGPGYTIVDEPPAAGEYQLGSIAMAKTSAPDSAGSQFFIITGSDGVALPPEYALFGQVTEGLDSTVAAMAAAGTPGAGVPSEPIEIESIRIVQR